MAKAGALYEQDFFLWTKEQAAALRAGTESSNPPSSSAESVANRDRGDQRRRRSVAIDLSEDEAISLMSRAGKSSGLAAEVSRWPRPAPSITYPATSGVTRTAWSPWPAIARKG